MKLLRRKWHYTEQQRSLTDPAATLARHIAWKRSLFADSPANYIEPCNIIAASAWQGLPPKHAEATTFILYKCDKSNLWIQSISTWDYDHESSITWMQEQLKFGAVDVWSNIEAESMEYQPITDDDVSNIPKENRPVFVDIETQLKQINDIDEEDIPDSNMFKIKNGAGNPKPILTPKGVFESVKKASLYIGVSTTWIGNMARRGENGFKYLDELEWQKYNEENSL